MKIAPILLFTPLLALANGWRLYSDGNMTTSRIGYSSTLLPNGKVLIAGGLSGHNYLSSTKLYDPSTGVFAPAANMTTARGSHAAILLPDGSVFIFGGASASAPSAELYDPSTGVFSPITGLLDGAGRAILLANGNVLIVHGDMFTEIYDPVLGTFSATGNQFYYNGDATAVTLLPNGRVLLPSCCYPQDQLYDPSLRTFSLTGGLFDPDASTSPSTMDVYADGLAGTKLANGNVLVSGDFEEETNSTGIEARFYDWRTGVFVRTGDMTTPRYSQTETTLGDGTVLIAGSGGMPYVLIPAASAEIYDPVQGVFAATGSMNRGRYGHTATLLLDGRVLIAGSADGTQSAEIYTPSTPVPARRFSRAPSGTPRRGRSLRPIIPPLQAKHCRCTAVSQTGWTDKVDECARASRRCSADDISGRRSLFCACAGICVTR